eukprot:498626-Rhodomonas_salina.1
MWYICTAFLSPLQPVTSPLVRAAVCPVRGFVYLSPTWEPRFIKLASSSADLQQEAFLSPDWSTIFVRSTEPIKHSCLNIVATASARASVFARVPDSIVPCCCCQIEFDGGDNPNKC